MSQWHEREKVKERLTREGRLKEAMEYCIEKGCKGYAAIASGLFPLIKDPRTINRRLEDAPGKSKIVTGQEKSYCKMLTEKEETSLVRYLLNRNRCRQGVTEKEGEGIVLNILRTRDAVNRKGGRKAIPLTNNARKSLQKNSINGRKFFERLKAIYPALKSKRKNKVSLKRGLRCTRLMATEHLDELAGCLIETGIAPDLKQVEPGVWRGKIDTARIWAHDETPQFINYQKKGCSRAKVFAGSGEDCDELVKENRECVTVQPFSNFKGDQALCQVIFSGSGHSSHMCPKSAAEKILNLMISVNESGYSDHKTLNYAYKQLDKVVEEKNQTRPIIIIADGHKSRFGSDVMETCSDKSMDQYLLPPDTSGATQFHDQVNNRLNDKYEEKKDELYTDCSDINKDAFMTILGDIWKEWVTPEQLVKAGKRVGISDSGLDINWMDQTKFEAAEAILNPPDVMKTPSKISKELLNSTIIESPDGVRKGSAEYYRRKLEQSLEHIQYLSETTPNLEEVPGLMPFKRINPKSKNKFVTKMHGSLKATELRVLVEEREQAEKEAQQRKEEKQLKKEEMIKAFNVCKLKCQCKNECEAIHLKECSVCFGVLKTQCHKKACKDVEGKLPKMTSVAAKKIDKPTKGQKRKRKEINYEDSEDSENFDDSDLSDDNVSDDDDDDYGDKDSYTTQKKTTHQAMIEKAQESLDEDKKGSFYCVYYNEARFWGKLLKVFSYDPDSPVDEVELDFLHYQVDGIWDWPKPRDVQRIFSKFIFYGPVENTPGKKGFKFPCDAEAEIVYNSISRWNEK